MEEGRGVNIKHFGSFTFEPVVANDGNVRNPRAPSIKLRPCFIISPEMEKHLRPGESKDQLDVHVEGSIYQQGVRMSYLNPVPIAAACYYKAEFVRTTIDTIFRALADLAIRGFNLDIEFRGLCSLCLVHRKLTVKFSISLSDKLTVIEQSYPLRSVNRSVPAIGPKREEGNISHVHAAVHAKKRDSRLSSLQRPNSTMLKDIKDRIEKLSESSKDLVSISCNNA